MDNLSFRSLLTAFWLSGWTLLMGACTSEPVVQTGPDAEKTHKD